jgi:hypothetical protein
MPTRNPFHGRAVMRSLVLTLMLSLSGAALAGASEPSRTATDERTLTDAVFVRPLYGMYRHCGGACLKSGALSWYCFTKQTCYLSCATAPPQMKCAVP